METLVLKKRKIMNKYHFIMTLMILYVLFITPLCQGISSSQLYETSPIISFGKGEVTSDGEDSMDPSTMPYFDYQIPRNISTVVGQHAFLLCRVYRMKDRSVSWIRKRDLHILTAGIYTYTTDQRFVVIHPEKSENWTLQIKYPQTRDAGVYECQVNTEPKISMAFQLNVIESKARIIGGSEVHVKSGSSLRLTCEVEHGPHDIAQVFWYHESKLVDPQGLFEKSLSSDIRLVTQRGELLTSQLTILKARSNHSGNYTCSPTMAVPASVIVHVISGEHPAAMQHGNRSSSSHTRLKSLQYFLLYSLLAFAVLLYSSSTVSSELTSIIYFNKDSNSSNNSNANSYSNFKSVKVSTVGNNHVKSCSFQSSCHAYENLSSIDSASLEGSNQSYFYHNNKDSHRIQQLVKLSRNNLSHYTNDISIFKSCS